MEFIRKLGVAESIVGLNFLSFLFIWYWASGLHNSKLGVVFTIDVIAFIPWLVTAIPAVVVSLYRLLHLGDTYSDDDRTKRLVVCSICLLANIILVIAMIVPNPLFTFQLTNLYFTP